MGQHVVIQYTRRDQKVEMIIQILRFEVSINGRELTVSAGQVTEYCNVCLELF